MKDENVEFNEIRCNKLILGNKETGSIALRIDDEDGAPNLMISNNDEGNIAAISISFSNGAPILSLANTDGKKEGVIRLSFNDEGFPELILSKKGDENEEANAITLGFDDGVTVLHLSNGQNEDRGFVSLNAKKDGRLLLMLGHRNIKGGSIIFSTDKANAAMAITSTDRLKNEDAPWGLYIETDVEGSKLEVEGENYISKSRKDKEIGEPREDEEVDSEV